MIQRRHILVGSNMLAVAEDSDRITHLKYFFHAMGDIEHHPPFIAQPFNDAFKLANFLNGEATGRFIKGDHLGIAQQCPANFDHLLLADREFTHLG